MFDDVVAKAALTLSEKHRMDERMESLISQNPVLHTTHSPALILQKNKDLDTPLELSPGKEKAMYKPSAKFNERGPRIHSKNNKNNNNNYPDDDQLDFSSDEDNNEPYPPAPLSNSKLERVALNRPSAHRSGGANPKGRETDRYDDDSGLAAEDEETLQSLALEGGLVGGSFYEAQDSLESDEDDNAALFEGFTAPTISGEPTFSTQSQSFIAHPGRSSSIINSHNSNSNSNSKSLSRGAGTISNSDGVITSNSVFSGLRVNKPPAVPATHTTKELSSRGVVVGKGGLFIRAPRKLKGPRDT